MPTPDPELIAQFEEALKEWNEPQLNKVAKLLFQQGLPVFDFFGVDCVQGVDGEPVWLPNPMAEEDYQLALTVQDMLDHERTYIA